MSLGKEIRSNIADMENLHTQSIEIYDGIKTDLNTVVSKLTPEEKKRFDRFQKRLEICIQNNDSAGILKLQNNFK